MNKTSIIRLIDENVDGCGTNIKTDMKITGQPVNKYLKEEIKHVITVRKRELGGEYTTDDILEAVENYLKSANYTVEYIRITPDITISF